jgi:hypothetical protein
MAGQQPQTQVHQAPGGQASPGFGWARGFFNSLPGVTQNPFPSYQGQIDPGLSPTMQNTIRMAQGYSQAGPSEILQGAQGSLGRFMTPSFMDPRMRLPQGNPNLFGADPNQRMYGGGLLSQLGQGYNNQTGGGLQGSQMNQGMPQIGGIMRGQVFDGPQYGWQSAGNQQGGGRMPAPGQPPQSPWAGLGGSMQSMGGGGSQAPQMGSRGPAGMQSMTGPGLQSGGGGGVGQRMPWSGGPPQDFQWGGSGGGGMQSATGPGLQSSGPQMAFRGGSGSSPMSFATGPGLQASPMPAPAGGGMQFTTGGGLQAGGQAPGQFSGQVGDQASKAWDMGNQANRGQVQNGQIFLGGGQGGDSGQWQTYDPNNWGHQQSANMFNRYGSNWAAGAGSGGTGAHSSEMKGWLQSWLGRDPTQQEEMDLYYGVNPDKDRIRANAIAQNAAYDPSSAGYDPNARYSSAAYRGPRPQQQGQPPGQGQGQVRQPQRPDLAALLSGMRRG